MKKFLLLAGVSLLVGCANTNNKPIADDPYYAPIYPATPPKQIVKTGSLFDVNQLDSLYADVKARRVGDIIEVILSESTSAKKNANSNTKKENSVTLSPVTGLGKNVTIGGNTLDFGLDQDSEFKGTGSADQSNSLSGSISVSVVQVLGNGNLIVRGEKWITINNGDEFIRLNGIVRPQDISADNQIESIRVANARIQYSGTGSFADAQKAGWLARFFNSNWWPF
ncbi:flagellar basal body L-ring protein FlgH [Psychrobium sp. 1_MG-2023]|uniref:flagellar basal body L-ring protein FlgH n=1 Tax=Psychrobium sp. 1_MG-2023 TaxID=3062624 RepID=UPI000C3424E3|nr:flagellar basal body L-ring protein FlgH [Psychrobium sp. 1_MG-2023]MDP2559867.1 flagellar basal body L-ring protein FlgH [Psychrobium sp. 1_MG-2023]PKF59032.1 flagellar basal body L-ring protein FlgH [Alteromonadales bacterium alter-6D02]